MERRPAVSSPADYLRNKTSREIEVDESRLEQLLQPLFDYEYQKEGVIETKIKDLDFRMAYRPIVMPEKVDMEILKEQVQQGYQLTADELLGCYFQTFEQYNDAEENIREVTEFSMKNGNTSWDLKKFGDTKLYISILTKHLPGFNIYESFNNRIFLLSSSILSRDGLVGLFHELGHAATLPELSKDGLMLEANRKADAWKNNTGPAPKIKDTALLLESERAAWAYAFNALKPFMKDLDISVEDLSAIKDQGLKSYHDFIWLASLLSKERDQIRKT